MRFLDEKDQQFVSGGGEELEKQVADTCEGLPDSANVTVTVTKSGNLGGIFGKLMGSGEAGQSTSIKVNCGDFRESQSGEGGNS